MTQHLDTLLYFCHLGSVREFDDGFAFIGDM